MTVLVKVLVTVPVKVQVTELATDELRKTMNLKKVNFAITLQQTLE